jgi:hypothetical protein
MTDRCWRKSLTSTGSGREFYPTDAAPGGDVDFVLPSMSTVFQITIPEGTFIAGAGSYVLGVFKVQTHYKFSQRRTDINQLVAAEKAKLK